MHLLLLSSKFGVGASLTIASLPRHSKIKNPKASSPQKQSKLWRYSEPKRSRWDIRHTKSFRFELQPPSLTSTVSSPSQLVEPLQMYKKPKESLSHVMGKGILWALFKEDYGLPPTQTIFVETPIPQESRFVPDVVAFEVPPSETVSHNNGQNITIPLQVQHHNPTFWGESGRMSTEKAAALAWKYPHTHIVHLRWGSQMSMDIFEEIETAVLPSLHYRTAPFEFALLSDKPQVFVDDDGTVLVRKEDLQWRTARFDIDLAY